MDQYVTLSEAVVAFINGAIEAGQIKDQKTIAEWVGVSPGQVSKYLSGKEKITTDFLDKVLEHMNIDGFNAALGIASAAHRLYRDPDRFLLDDVGAYKSKKFMGKK